MTETVEAEVIEPSMELDVAIVEPQISDNITALSAYVDEAIEPYIGWEVDVSDRKRIAEAKKVIAELPKLKRCIEDERKRVKRLYEEPMKAWEARVREVTDRIENAYRGVKDQIDAAEDAAREHRRNLLASVYEEFAPALVPMVPFERILDNAWLRLSVSEKKAEADMCDAVAQLAKDWEVLKASNLRCGEETEAEFFRTLDLNAALAFDTAHADEMARLADLKAEVEPEPEPVATEGDEGEYRFTIEVPRTVFYTSVLEARALKNHLALLGIDARMTKAREAAA